jgi:hypothetical protein
MASIVGASIVAVGLAEPPVSAAPRQGNPGQYAVTAATTYVVPDGTQISFSQGSGTCVKDLHTGSVTVHKSGFQQAFRAFVADLHGSCENRLHTASLRIELREKSRSRTVTLHFTEERPADYKASCSGGMGISCPGFPAIRPGVVELKIVA